MDPIHEAFDRLWPEAELRDLLDTGLASNRARSAALSAELRRRIHALADYAYESGTDAILFTCSAFGEAIVTASRRLSIPVLRPNEAMFEAALKHGGLAAELYTFEPARAGMESEYEQVRKEHKADQQIRSIAVPDALEALRSGNEQEHNRLVSEVAANLHGFAVIMLAHSTFACQRIAKTAFALARERGAHVTAVHKANNFLLTDGLFLGQVREVAKSFPEVRLEEVIVDAMAAHLVRDPSRFDVIVTTNFYADILSDLASELSGGLGLAGSLNANTETGLVCAQAQHGSAPDIQNQNIANPTSLILSAAMMLSWLGEQRGLSRLSQAGAAIQVAVDTVLADPQARTRDLGGSTNTDRFGSLVAEALLAAEEPRQVAR